ncbi:MAG: branched-chain amino acid ABC transporter permease [Anaerolineales bacterium]
MTRFWQDPGLRSAVYVLMAIVLGFLVPYLVLYLLDVRVLNPQQQFVNAVWRGSVYSLFALGYALVFSILGLLNLAHSAIFMWGAFLGLAAVTQADLPLLVALPAGMVGGGLVGWLVDFVAFRPLRQRNAPRIAQLISSIGVAIMLINLASIVFGTNTQRFPQDRIEAVQVPGDQPVEWSAGEFSLLIEPPFDPTVRLEFIYGEEDVSITVLQIAILLTALVLMFALQYLVANTRLGQAMRTVAFNAKIASLLGVNNGQIVALTFFMAGALAGAAGVLHGLAFNSMTPYMGESIALTGLTVIVIGGLGSIRGTVVGGFLIANAEVITIAAGYSWLEDAVVFSALFIALLVRPQGLLGEQKVEKV